MKDTQTNTDENFVQEIKMLATYLHNDVNWNGVLLASTLRLSRCLWLSCLIGINNVVVACKNQSNALIYSRYCIVNE